MWVIIGLVCSAIECHEVTVLGEGPFATAQECEARVEWRKPKTLFYFNLRCALAQTDEGKTETGE